mmetsp:Transcript_17992/g.23187  ORF Transcript_17992/g.23187 Transcript_17992/m.23187 type:complete len:342 (-) Transcript_17992:40-1065(-)
MGSKSKNNDKQTLGKALENKKTSIIQKNFSKIVQGFLMILFLAKSAQAFSNTPTKIFPHPTPRCQLSNQQPAIRHTRRVLQMDLYGNLKRNGTENEQYSNLESRIDSLEKRLETQARVIKTLRSKTVTTKQKGRKVKTVTVDQAAVENGSVFAFAILGMIVGRSVSRKLWLVGSIFSAYVGSVLAKKPGKIGVKIRKVGLWFALKYKDLIDFYETTIYLYKTGMLGATYYKRWEKVDNQYKLTQRYQNFAAAVKGEYTKADMKYDITTKSKNLAAWLQQAAWGAGDKIKKEVQNFDRKKKLTDRLPIQIRGIFKSKKEYRDELLKEYRVKFCGQRKWRPFP